MPPWWEHFYLTWRILSLEGQLCSLQEVLQNPVENSPPCVPIWFSKAQKFCQQGGPFTPLFLQLHRCMSAMPYARGHWEIVNSAYSRWLYKGYNLVNWIFLVDIATQWHCDNPFFRLKYLTNQTAQVDPDTESTKDPGNYYLHFDNNYLFFFIITLPFNYKC